MDGCKGSAHIILALEGTLICRQLPIVKFMNEIKPVLVPYTKKTHKTKYNHHQQTQPRIEVGGLVPLV